MPIASATSIKNFLTYLIERFLRKRAPKVAVGCRLAKGLGAFLSTIKYPQSGFYLPFRLYSGTVLHASPNIRLETKGCNWATAHTYTEVGTLTLLHPFTTTFASRYCSQFTPERVCWKSFSSSWSSVPNSIALANGLSDIATSIYAHVGIIASTEQVIATNLF